MQRVAALQNRKKTLIEVKGLNFRYNLKDRVNLLKGVNFDIYQGEIVLLMGGSGCGKSTLSNIICGLLPENQDQFIEGSISIDGQSVRDMEPSRRAKHISTMFQNYDFQFCMGTLREELIFCLENIKFHREKIDERIEWTVKSIGIEDLLDQPLHTLSGGEKQKAQLCCNLVLGSKCLILDEPFANLDSSSRMELIDRLRRLNTDHDITIVAVEHQMDMWLDTATRIILLDRGGRVVLDDIPPGDIYSYGKYFKEQGIILPDSSIDTQAGKTFTGETEDMIDIRNTSITHLNRKNKVLELFAREDKGATILSDINMTLRKGRITAILGRSGSGKSTLLKTLMGYKRYRGSIEVGSRELSKISGRELSKKLGIVFQNPRNQFVTHNVADEILYSLKRSPLKGDDEPYTERSKELLEEYGLYRYKERSPYTLSEGEQRRLAVLAVLASGQDILFLDEPTYGQDYISTTSIMKQLDKKVKEDDLTVVFVTHDEGLAKTWADDIYIIEGREVRRAAR